MGPVDTVECSLDSRAICKRAEADGRRAQSPTTAAGTLIEFLVIVTEAVTGGSDRAAECPISLVRGAEPDIH
ncbi:MAG TPA: hypothetical protein VMQ60_02195 [Acidobacteriaceae bacterium]|nr:hypothetical protein [Acidobacteriaceae bacterium]